MGEVYRFLPSLGVNRQFMSDFLSAATPCFALGLVEERKQRCGFLALRPSEDIPPEVSDAGFLFGHSVFGDASFEVVHFAFHFYGFKTYNALVNPNNPLVRSVLTTMVERGDYFCLTLSEREPRVTTFRSELGEANLAGLRTNLRRIQCSATTDAEYQRTVSSFQKNPDPPGVLLDWVCHDRLEYLDVANDYLELTPSAGRDTRPPPADMKEPPTWHSLEKLPLIASLIDGQLETCQEQLRNLNPAGRKSPVLDDALVERMIRVYTEQQEDIPIFSEQLSRWQNDKPSEPQRSEIERLRRQLNCWETAVKELLDLAREYQGFTIEKVLARDDVEVAFDVLSGRMRRWL